MWYSFTRTNFDTISCSAKSFPGKKERKKEKKKEISKDVLTKVYHKLLLQELCKKPNIELNFEKITKLAREINPSLQIITFANKSNAQKLKFETEKKIEVKFDLFEEKNEYEKMEKDVIKGILKNEKLLLRKEGIQYK